MKIISLWLLDDYFYANNLMLEVSPQTIFLYQKEEIKKEGYFNFGTDTIIQENHPIHPLILPLSALPSASRAHVLYTTGEKPAHFLY